MQDRYDDPTRISRHHAEQDIMVRQWLLHIPWMKKYAESSSLNKKVTRKDEDRDQDGLTIMILRPPKCETQCLVSTDNLWKWWMLNWPLWRAETNGECQARQIWKNGECPIGLNLESGNLGQWWMSKSETMVNVSGQSIGYVTAITRFDCKKYDSMSSGVNIKNMYNE